MESGIFTWPWMVVNARLWISASIKNASFDHWSPLLTADEIRNKFLVEKDNEQGIAEGK